jgi:hypothetical protein
LQRDGVRVRSYSIDPGEIVPCAAFPEDDLVVVALKADLAGVDTVTISVAAANGSFRTSLEDVPVAAAEGEVLWATPGVLIRQMPSSQVTLSVAAGNQGRSLGEYVLDHTAGVVEPR